MMMAMMIETIRVMVIENIFEIVLGVFHNLLRIVEMMMAMMIENLL